MKRMSKWALERQELIGCPVEVLHSPCPNDVGLKGIIVDETRNMLIVDTGKGDKMIAKKGAKFAVCDGYEILGDRIQFRPEDRIKRVR